MNREGYTKDNALTNKSMDGENYFLLMVHSTKGSLSKTKSMDGEFSTIAKENLPMTECGFIRNSMGKASFIMSVHKSLINLSTSTILMKFKTTGLNTKVQFEII